jgi:hypothetical protein
MFGGEEVSGYLVLVLVGFGRVLEWMECDGL